MTPSPFVRLTVYRFWRAQTENSPRGVRYSCQIRHDHHIYEATAGGPEVAIDQCLEKVAAGWKRGKGRRPKLRMVSA